jgi:hypothetical protein
MIKLFEGLRENDLEDLVLPMLSIDEYESKVDDDAIVIGFYVMDREPAQDLNRFIQKSPIVLIDTDVSPAPNEDGYYMVFVELPRDEAVTPKIKTLLDEIKSLVHLEPTEWSFTCYGHEGVFPLNDKNLHVLVRKEPIEELEQRMFAESINSFFSNSALDNLLFHRDKLYITKGANTIGATIVSFGSENKVSEWIENKATIFTESANRTCRIWEQMLGEGWAVHLVENIILLSNTYDSKYLVLRT